MPSAAVTTEQVHALHAGFMFILCGLVGAWGFNQARLSHAYQSERMGGILDEHITVKDYSLTLRRMEVTVSQAIHDTATPHATIFRAIFLALALLHLQAGAVQYELYPLHEAAPEYAYGGFLTLLGALRTALAPVSAVLIVFVPTGKPLVDLRQRLARASYEPTKKDEAVYLAFARQYSLHMLAAQLGCFLAPILDAIGTCYALSRYAHAGSEPHGTMVHPNSAELAPSVMWLAASVARLLTLVTAVTCGLRFAAEVFSSAAVPKYKLNPLRVALPESMLIRNTIWSYALGGVQLLFVDEAAWVARGLGFGVVLIVLSAPIILYPTVKALLHLNFVLRIDGALSERNCQRIIDSLVAKRAAYMAVAAAGLRGESASAQRATLPAVRSRWSRLTTPAASATAPTLVLGNVAEEEGVVSATSTHEAV